ncbi:MAG: hypothetical protein LW806_00585 [Planctomycetaceae bacterium]|nr:hypothetical protein [Planctomycetaceae bacterium]
MRHTSPRLFVATIALNALLAPSLAFAMTTAQSTPASSDAAPSKPSRKTAECTAGGFAIEHEPTWLSQIEGAMVLLIPSLDAVDEQDPEFYAASSTDCADPAKVADDAGFDALLLASFQGASKLVRKGAVERRADGILTANYEATDEAGQTRPVCVACRVVGGKMVTVLALCTDKSIASRTAAATALAASVRAIGAASPTDAAAKPAGRTDMQDGDANGKTDGKTPAKTTGEVAADGTRETLNEIGGYGFRHDAKWRVEQQGPTTTVLPAVPLVEGQLPEFYALTSVAWDDPSPLANGETALKAARALLATDEIAREGDVEKLPGGGVVVRSSVPTADGGRMQVRVIARAEKGRLVGVGILAMEKDIARNEKIARDIFATVRFIPVKEVVGAADAAFIGTWSTEEVLSAGGGFDAGGSATMVTERILDLAADGRYTISSRSAGGGPGATFDSPADVVQRGTWTVTREGERATLNLRSSDGGTTPVACALFEGKLVLGPAGQRKFFTRVR